MTIQTTNHLNFRGDARAALTFHQSVFGGDLVIVTYEDTHSADEPKEAKQIMWGQVSAENGFRVMAYDVPGRLPWDAGKNAFFVSLRGESADEIPALWEKLSAGAKIVQPLGPSGWAPLYGMLIDRFGITWVLDVVAKR